MTDAGVVGATTNLTPQNAVSSVPATMPESTTLHHDQQQLPHSPLPQLQPYIQQQQQQPLAQSPVPQTPNLMPAPSTRPIASAATSTKPAPGAPGRSYLNAHLAPCLRIGMTEVLNVRPQFPLRYLGEYLIAQSFIHEGATDDNGIRERFTYPEHTASPSLHPPPHKEDDDNERAGKVEADHFESGAKATNETTNAIIKSEIEDEQENRGPVTDAAPEAGVSSIADVSDRDNVNEELNGGGDGDTKMRDG